MHCFFSKHFASSIQPKKTFSRNRSHRSLLRRCFLAEGSSRNGTFHPAAVAFCMLFCPDPSSSSSSSDAGALTNTPSQLQPARSSLRAREHNQKKPDHRSTRERASERARSKQEREKGQSTKWRAPSSASAIGDRVAHHTTAGPNTIGVVRARSRGQQQKHVVIDRCATAVLGLREID